MDIKEMRDRLKSKEYDFIRTDKRLGTNIVLLTTGGSYAYGTNIETKDHVSDFDVRGIYLNSREEILTMNCRDKPIENHDLDCTIYPLKEIIKLLINVNPNTIEILGTKPKHLFICNSIGELLRNNIGLFLSKRVYASFGGYAIQQLRRLENALAHDSYPQDKKEKHILGSVEKQMLTFEDRYQNISDDSLKLYIDQSIKETMDKEIFIDLNLNHYPLRDLKGMLCEMRQIIVDYDKLNHRNSKKDRQHLLKHGMHLIRLLLMGTEILQGKGINTYRTKDRDLLLNIRNGKYTYDEIFVMADKYNKEFDYAKKHSDLPDNPNISKINELVAEINEKVINNEV